MQDPKRAKNKVKKDETSSSIRFCRSISSSWPDENIYFFDSSIGEFFYHWRWSGWDLVRAVPERTMNESAGAENILDGDFGFHWVVMLRASCWGQSWRRESRYKNNKMVRCGVENVSQLRAIALVGVLSWRKYCRVISLKIILPYKFKFLSWVLVLVFDWEQWVPSRLEK